MLKNNLLKYILAIVITTISYFVFYFIIFTAINFAFNAAGAFTTTDETALSNNFTFMQFVQNAFMWVGIIVGIVVSSKLLKYDLKNIGYIIAVAIIFYTLLSYLMFYTTTFALPSLLGYIMIGLVFIVPLTLIYFSMNKLKA